MEAFGEPLMIAALLADFRSPWSICGGWAIDLFLDGVTRQHKDVDIALLRRDQLAMQSYLTARGWILEKAMDGARIPWQEGEWITLPVHTIWCQHPTVAPGFLEILLNEASSTHFLFRRDSSITLPLSRMSLRTAVGLPILAPEIVLLYNANHPAHEGNAADFLSALSALDSERRAWLQTALARLDQEHVWLSHF